MGECTVDDGPWSIRKRGTVFVLGVSCDLDAVAAPQLEDLINEIVSGGGRDIVIDMTDVMFVACSVTSILLWLAEDLKRKGGRLKMCGLEGGVRDVFHLLDPLQLVELFDDQTAAFFSYPPDARKTIGVRERRTSLERRKSTELFHGKNRRKKERRFSASVYEHDMFSFLLFGGPWGLC